MSETYVISIQVEGKDTGASGVLDGMAGALGRVGEFVVGGLIVGGIQKIGQALGGLARSAIGSVSNIQMLEKSMAGLVSQNLMYQRQADGTFQQVMSFGDASDLAAAQVQDLLAFVEELSIVSPFETADVEQVTKIGLAAGLATDQVKDFTGAFLDFAAVQGVGDIQFAAEQFLQLKQAGALATVDLRQLRRMGIDVARIIGTDMSGSIEDATDRFGELSPEAQKVFSGMELDIKEFNKIAKDSPEVLDAIFQKFILLSEETAGGAAADMATTIQGMMGTVSDIIDVGSRKLFRPIAEAVGPVLADVLGDISDFVTGPAVAELGEKIGAAITTGIEFFERFVNVLQAGGGPLEAIKIAITGLVPQETAQRIFDIVNGIRDVLDILSPFGESLMSVIEAFSLLAQGDISGFFENISIGWQAVFDGLSGIWEAILPHLETLLQNVSEWFLAQDWGAIIGQIFSGYATIGETIWANVAPSMVILFSNILTWAGEQDWGAIILSIVSFFVDFGISLWTTIQPTLLEFFTSVSTWFLEQDWMTIGVNIVTGIIEGLAEFYTNVAITFEEWATSFSTWVESVNWYGVGFDIVTAIIEGLAAFIETVSTTLDTWFTNISTNLSGKDWGAIGSDIVSGIATGIVNAGGAILTALGDAVQGAIDAVKARILESNSPSKVTSRLLGKPMGQGVGVGFVSEMDIARGAMGKSLRATTRHLAESQQTYDQRQFGGDEFNVQVNDQSAMDMFLGFVEERKTQRLNASMGAI